MFKGLVGLVHLIISIWAILNVLGSNASTLHKVLWSLFILFFPVIGLIVWFLAGPGKPDI